jgi:hypothetical protein
MVSMTRRNVITRPIQAIEVTADSYRKDRDETSAKIKRSIERRDPDNWERDRGVVVEMAKWAVDVEIISWLDEAIDALDPQAPAEDVDAVLMALRERGTKTVTEPSWDTIRAHFAEAQRQFGVDFSETRFPEAEYGDYFHLPIDTFGFYYSIMGSMSVFVWQMEALIGALRADDEYALDAETRSLVNERHRRMAAEITDEQVSSVLDEINSSVTKRDTYGVHRGVISSPDFTILSWSTSGQWIINTGWDKTWVIRRFLNGRPEIRLSLDADQVVVPFPEQVVELVLSSIYPLPLHRYSHEARFKEPMKAGPIVGDREVNTIVKSLVLETRRMEAVERYGMTPEWAEENVKGDDNYFKMLVKQAVSDLIRAKANQDLNAFNEVLSSLNAAAFPSFEGRLTTWFGGGGGGAKTNPGNEETDEFEAFVQDVRDDFERNKGVYLRQAQEILSEELPGNTVVEVALIGSYSPGRTPREDSDVDMKVVYSGPATPEDVAAQLAGHIVNHAGAGVFDVWPEQQVEQRQNPDFIEELGLIYDDLVAKTDWGYVSLQDVYDAMKRRRKYSRQQFEEDLSATQTARPMPTDSKGRICQLHHVPGATKKRDRWNVRDLMGSRMVGTVSMSARRKNGDQADEADAEEEPDPATYMSFMSGDCWLLAVALREVTGLDVYGLKDDAGNVHHAFVATGKTGVAIDYRGQNSVRALATGCAGAKIVKLSDREIARWSGGGTGVQLTPAEQRGRACPRACSSAYSDREWEYALETARRLARRTNPDDEADGVSPNPLADSDDLAQRLYDASFGASEIPQSEVNLSTADRGHPVVDEPERYRWFLIRKFPVKAFGLGLADLLSDVSLDFRVEHMNAHEKARHDKIVSLLRDGDAWPAIVTADGILIDGYHRVAANRTLKRKTMPVVVAVERSGQNYWDEMWLRDDDELRN